MKKIQIRLSVLASILLMYTSIVKGQTSLHLAKDSLVSSLKERIEELRADKFYKNNHFLLSDQYDYFSSINSLRFVNEINSVMSQIDLPVEQNQLVEISFVQCYDWTEARETWFITLIDKSGNHHIYFYETGMEKPHKYGVKQGGDYFYRLAENLFGTVRCEEKNEDYIVFGKLAGSRFISYFSSQLYHGMDIVFFYELLEILSN